MTSISSYYDRLSRWTAVARLFGHGGGRQSLSVHRALADPHAGGRATTRRLHDVLVHHLPPLSAPRVLDAGCGFGGTMLHLRERIGGSYLGLTLSETQALVATRATSRAGVNGNIRILVRSYDDPPAGPFDLILAIESLAHSSNPSNSLTSLVRVLAPNGVLVIVDDMPEPSAEDSADLSTFRSGWRCPVVWSRVRYVEALADLGLTTIVNCDLTAECRPRALGRIERLETLNRALHRAIPSAGWRDLMDAHRGGLALERLYRKGLMGYWLLIARRSV